MTVAAGYVDSKTIKRLSVLDPGRTALIIAFDWLVIAAAIVLSEWAHNLVIYFLAVLVIGGRMHALGVLVHEFAHYRFISNKRLSDWIGDIFTAWPVLTTVDGYRNNHLAHHRYTNTERDPDWIIKIGTRKFTFPQSWRTALISLAGYLFIVGSLFDLAMIVPRVGKTDKSTLVQKLVRLGFYIAVLIVLALTNAWLGFAKYWVLPYFTIFFLLLYIRSVAEHFGSMEYGHELTETRSVLPFFWEGLFFSPHNVNYHLEHHLFPSVPWYNLPVLHAELMKNADYAAHAHITRGYTVGLVRECLV